MSVLPSILAEGLPGAEGILATVLYIAYTADYIF